MTEDTSAGQHGHKSHQESPGGSSSRGPEYGTGNEPDGGLIPPYDDLRGDNTGEGAEATRKAFDASHAGEPGPGAVESDEERSGMSATEMNPEPALGVGKSSGGRAEDLAPDRDDVGTKSESGRPVGTVSGDETNTDDKDRPQDPRSPHLGVGDQGG